MAVVGSDLGEGDAFGDFVIGAELGRGAMGVVFAAVQASLGRRVALKLIADDLADDPLFRSRFEQEARALASLDSRHVVGVFTFGEIDGQLYIATQLIDGGDVGALLARTSGLPLADAVDIAEQVAAGLVDAHRVGLVHRDVKPGNVLLRRVDEEWQAFLCDFGVVRPERSDHTQTGVAVGTPSYMAPEVHTGARATAASDVYSVGCLLWALVTGRAPYSGATGYALIQAHLQGPVPQLPPGPGAGVNAILRRAMAKDPADRYRSAAELRQDLGAERRRLAALPPTRVAPPAPASAPPSSMAPTQAPPRPPPPPPRRRGTAIVASVTVLVLASVAATVWWLGSDDGSDGAGGGPTSGPTSLTSSPSSSPPTSDPAPSDEVFGSGCAALSTSGPGSLARLAQVPLGEATRSLPTLTSFALAVDTAGLDATLDAAAELTVFAPTDEAFAKLPQDVLAAVLQDPSLTSSVLRPHVVSEAVAPDAADRTYDTLDGDLLRAERTGGEMTVSIGASRAQVVCGNIPTTNGRLYLVDAVLMPG